jgi:hypothetical protein
MQLTPTQRQLVLTAMDPAAAPTERATAAAFLFRSLARRYADGYALLTDLEHTITTPGANPSSRYGSVTMPFGKYRGRPLSEIDATYLLWAWTMSRPWIAHLGGPSSGTCRTSNAQTKIFVYQNPKQPTQS